MKTASSFLCFALLSALAIEPAFAEPVTVKITARVYGWNDSAGVFNGQIPWGSLISGTYSYDTEAPTYPQNGPGAYRPLGTQASISLRSGTFVFESVPESQFDLAVEPIGTLGSTDGRLRISSVGNRPLAPGVWVNGITFTFIDPTGQEPTSTALPAGAPDLQRFTENDLRIQGNDSSFHNFEVWAQIETAELVPPAIEVSPGKGNFLAQQRFDAALLLPVGSQIATMQASAGGTPLPLSYPGTCSLAPPNSANRPAILCPDAHTVLTTLGAGTPVSWHVELADGTLLDESVQWRLIP